MNANINFIKNNDIFQMAETALVNNNIIIPHVCNNIGVFGGGFASAVNNHSPSVKLNFQMLGNTAKLGYTQFVCVKTKTHHKMVFVNMIAQNKLIDRNKNPRPLNYMYLVSCMIKTKNYILDLNKQTDSTSQIFAPKFGCGLAGGNWPFVENLIEDIWQGIPVFIFQKKEIASKL